MNGHVDSSAILIVFACVAGTMCICALYRVFLRKPVFFFSVPGADFVESTVSGHGFRNCLVVAIASGRLIIRPFFPFNLLFPELRGLDVDVPLKDVAYAEIPPRSRNHLSGLLPVGTNVEICIRKGPRQTSTLELRLANPEAFVRLLPGRDQPQP